MVLFSRCFEQTDPRVTGFYEYFDVIIFIYTIENWPNVIWMDSQTDESAVFQDKASLIWSLLV